MATLEFRANLETIKSTLLDVRDRNSLIRNSDARGREWNRFGLGRSTKPMTKTRRVALAVVLSCALTGLIAIGAARRDAEGQDFVIIAVTGVIGTSLWVYAMWKARPGE